MRTRPLILALFATALAMAPRAATAQYGDGTQVREFIARNGELLGEATALVQETNSVKARGLLATATSLHAQSLGLLDQNQPLMAGRVALRAREVIQQTISVARREARIEGQAARMMERAAMRLEQARAAFEEAGHDDVNVRRMIVESTDNLRRAREQMQEHMFETALRLAESSLTMSTRAMRLMRRDGRGPDLAEEIDRTQRVIDRVTESRPLPDPALERMIDQAIELQRRAARSAEQGEPAVAVEQTRGARNLALRVLRAISVSVWGGGAAGASSEDEALRAVALTDDILEGARGMLAESPDDAVARRIEDASRRQEDARRALDAGDYPRALALTGAARDAVRTALRSVDVAVDPAAVEAALARTDDAIARLRAALADGGYEGARGFLERASARQRDARAALADGAPKRALALTRVAHNLARSGLSALEDVEN